MYRLISTPLWQKLLFLLEISFLILPNTVSASPLKYEFQSAITYSPIASMLGQSVRITLLTDPNLVFSSESPYSNFGSYMVPFRDISVQIGDYQWSYGLQAGNVRVQNDYVSFGTKQDAASFSVGSFSPIATTPSYSYNGIDMGLAMFDASIILRSPGYGSVPALSSNAFPDSFSGFDTTNSPGYSLSGGLMLLFMDPQTRLSFNAFGNFQSASLRPVPLPPSWALMMASLIWISFSSFRANKICSA